MRKCAKCGENLDGDARECTVCGAKAEALTDAAPCAFPDAPSLPDAPSDPSDAPCDFPDAAEEIASNADEGSDDPNLDDARKPPALHTAPRARAAKKSPASVSPKPKRRKRRIKKRFFAFLALLLLLPAGIAALIVFKPWEARSDTKVDPFRGVWTATRVDYMGSDYAAAQLFPNGIPVLTITKRRVTLSFSATSGKGRRTTQGDTVTFPCLGKTYSAQFVLDKLVMDMNGMTITFSQTQEQNGEAQAPDGGESSNPLAGTWLAEAYTSQAHGPGYASDLFKDRCTITLRPDGTGTVQADAYTESITWEATQDGVALTGTILFPSLTYKDGRLFGAYSRSGATLRFVRE